MLGVHLDHTDRCNVEKRLQMMERAIQATTQGILITDATSPDCLINYVNPAFESMTGYSSAEAIGRNCRFLQGQESDPRSIAIIRDCLQRKQSCKVELLNYRKDGVPFWNELSITPVLDEMGKLIHFIGIQTDVSQRRVLDEQLRQSQKMEAIGLLAGGIAHDFNNLLTIIDGYAYLLKCNSIESDTSKEFLDEIRSASRRANDLTRQLLAFGRRQLQSMEVLDFNQVISETVKMLKPLIGESVQVDLLLDPCVDRMWADRGQISQILMNLTLNAKEAMLSGGTISIRTERLSRSVSSASVSPKLSSENYVMLSVSDTGCGIPDSIQKSVFNPFFTTKPLGTGLGLSVVHGIVEQNGGTVEMESAVGLGTTFRVNLPQTIELIEQTQRESQPEATLCGNELILLVEDDAALRRVASIALSEYGYTVLMAASGPEALSVFGKNLHSIDLIVTDVVMPIMDGVELAEILAKKNPDLGVLFMSGYIAEEASRIQMRKRQGHFLQKPFSPIDLVRSVRRILDS